MSEWRNRIVGSGEEAPDQLVANPANWRTHPAAQRMALRGALSTVGWVQQVLVNQRTGHVVDGHARVEEALSKGEATVPVLYVDLSPEEEALVLATLDPIGAMATRDDERLRMLLAEVSVDDEGLTALVESLTRDGYSYQDRMNEWGGMPEFDQPANPPSRSIVVHFRGPEDWEDFARLIGQTISPKAKFIWHPKLERADFESSRYSSDAP